MSSRRGSSRADARVVTARLRGAVGSLDAEDIALARLQAHLRQAEAIHTATRPAAALRRTTVRLPAALLVRLRERAKRDSASPSQIVEKALLRFLRSR